MHLPTRAPVSILLSFFSRAQTVDGELCELFSALPPESQRTIASDLDRSPAEVLKKLEDTRNRLI